MFGLPLGVFPVGRVKKPADIEGIRETLTSPVFVYFVPPPYLSHLSTFRGGKKRKPQCGVLKYGGPGLFVTIIVPQEHPPTSTLVGEAPLFASGRKKGASPHPSDSLP